MPTTVTATAGEDTLCNIAMRAGFFDCAPLRAEPANAAFLTRDLQDGDIVTVPDLVIKEESRASEQKHRFQVKTAPPILIRYTHGSPDKPYREDLDETVLNISNWVTNKAGATMQQAFPSSTVFNPDVHVDEDAFKVEVVDPQGPGKIKIQIEAMRPVFAPDGTLTGHEQFAAALRGARSLETEGVKVPSAVCYRSPYLRLVVHETDHAAVPKQTLLVTDTADGNNGPEDALQILDQAVRASYTRDKCPGAAPNKCTVRTTLPVGSDKKHIRLCVHIFRPTAGAGSVGMGGVTEQSVRLRTRKWFQRIYAQANLSPKFVSPEVEFIDPPSDNMLVISDTTGSTASSASGAGAPSSISFDLTIAPGGAAAPPAPVNVNVPLPPRLAPLLPLTPVEIGGLIAAAMPAGFSAAVFPVCRATDAANGACDILITRADGQRVAILNETTNDTGLTPAGLRVARVNLDRVQMGGAASAVLYCHNMEVRRVARSAPGGDDRLDFFVVGAIFIGAANAARGLALVRGSDLPAPFQPDVQNRFAALMGRNSNTPGVEPVMDATDKSPVSYPHEAGHVLHDGFHTVPKTRNGATEMMTGDGTSVDDAVGASKRICISPVLVRYEFLDPSVTVQTATPGATKSEPTDAFERIRANGASVFESF